MFIQTNQPLFYGGFKYIKNEPKTKMMKYTRIIYRLAAIAAGIGWVVSILATIVNGELVFEFLQYVSGLSFEYNPMLDYWMKMAGLAFAFVGLGFLYCGIKWKEGLKFGLYFGSFQILSGIAVLLNMVRMEIDSLIYLMDCTFFLGTGIPMTWAWFNIRE